MRSTDICRLQELYAVKPVGGCGNWHPGWYEAGLTANDTVLIVICPNWEVEVDLPAMDEAMSKLGPANCLRQVVDPATNELLVELTTLDYYANVTGSIQRRPRAAS
ncbi:hypothetical protein SPBR_05373 [Sporothrix brasiliensis 5110]|uniref:Uncharacterized protein n=1 Tax=Sporothrix brasiliensis 5110 TaxID=1398154 RepID=A0A0C2F9K9_9PEZI|nr:uncharacterized protein SPBR_05373 [Sporothrix brasiliensis 5110]KIH87773.1 hypothetical protein SPBR_05373 [Sporothrix brasiliensis 5110]